MIEKVLKSPLLIFPLVLACLSLAAQGATLASFQFTGNSLSSTDASTSWTTTALTSGGGLPTVDFSGSIGNPTPSLRLKYSDINAASGTTSFDATDYYAFTITPDSGFQADFTQLTFDLQIGGVADVDWEIRSSVDSFAVAVGSGVVTSEDVFEPLAVSLTGLANQTAGTEFRIYLNTGGTNGNNDVFLDNIAVTGEVTAIPEPSVILVASLGSLLLLRRRRSS